MRAIRFIYTDVRKPLRRSSKSPDNCVYPAHSGSLAEIFKFIPDKIEKFTGVTETYQEVIQKK